MESETITLSYLSTYLTQGVLVGYPHSSMADENWKNEANYKIEGQFKKDKPLRGILCYQKKKAISLKAQLRWVWS